MLDYTRIGYCTADMAVSAVAIACTKVALRNKLFDSPCISCWVLCICRGEEGVLPGL